jgi:hypothetical protein
VAVDIPEVKVPLSKFFLNLAHGFIGASHAGKRQQEEQEVREEEAHPTS